MLDPNRTGVMIALLPTDTSWCKIECAHLTLVYAGTTENVDVTSYNELGKDALEIGMTYPPVTLNVLGIETFGDDGRGYGGPVDVFLLDSTPDLIGMRAGVEHWNASEHPFRPHVTIGPVGSAPEEIPEHLTFDRVMASWGTADVVASLMS